MADALIPIVVVPVIFFSFAYVVRIISDNGVRRRLVEKGIVDENVQHLFAAQYSEYLPNSLKWGMVLIAIGVAVLVGQLVPSSVKDEATIAAMFGLSGVALVAFYFIARRSEADDGDHS